MAVRTSAAAPGSLVQCLVWCFLLFLVECVLEPCQAKYVCSRQELINWGLQFSGVVTEDFHRANNIPMVIARPLGSPWIVIGSVKWRRWSKERKQRRGCRAGLLAKLRKQPHKPPLPLSNARSLVNKMDEMELQLAKPRGLLCVSNNRNLASLGIPNAAVQLTGRTIHQQDCSKVSCETRGGGLCLYVHNAWCSKQQDYTQSLFS